jgi:hypothetical protein
MALGANAAFSESYIVPDVFRDSLLAHQTFVSGQLWIHARLITLQ